MIGGLHKKQSFLANIQINAHNIIKTLSNLQSFYAPKTPEEVSTLVRVTTLLGVCPSYRSVHLREMSKYIDE